MLILSMAFAALSLILGLSFYRKYEARLRFESQNTLRYSRIADYFGRPILLVFEYRTENAGVPSRVEADVDEIYHYGRDYFLKGHSPDRKRCQIYKWSRISNPRIRIDGRTLESLDALFNVVESGSVRSAA